ncbi:MAG TPA: hypothetical protein VFB80_22655 [Pirellulaceae bacterium]|nr:hypothetical protein [Pirellulaceae bacterium]
MQFSIYRKAAVCAMLSLAWLAGCGPPPNVTAKGTVLRNNQPVKMMSPNGFIQVTLKPDVPPNQEFTTKVGRCNPDGTFEVLDVPPGRYVVGIEHLDPNPVSDMLEGKLTYNFSKIKREVDGKTPILIDLAKPE